MTSTLLGLATVLMFTGLIVAFSILATRRGRSSSSSRAAAPATRTLMRDIPGLDQLPQAVGEAVESGRRLHIAIGSGSLGGQDTSTTLAGLSAAGQIAAVAVVGDRPPLITSADGASMVLAYDLLAEAHKGANASERFDPNAARVVGLSPESYAAGALVLPKDERLSGTVLLGAAGPEAALIADANSRAGLTTIAGVDRVAAQAALFAVADHPVLGEDVFAAGAYISRRPALLASLQAQDWMRLLVIAGIGIGVLVKTMGWL